MYRPILLLMYSFDTRTTFLAGSYPYYFPTRRHQASFQGLLLCR